MGNKVGWNKSALEQLLQSKADLESYKRKRQPKKEPELKKFKKGLTFADDVVTWGGGYITLNPSVFRRTGYTWINPEADSSPVKPEPKKEINLGRWAV